MGIRSKILGLFVATGLSLSLVANAAAQDATSSGSVTLLQSVCSVTVEEGDDFDFGDWQWNGVDAYVYTGEGSASSGVTMTIGVPGPGDTCTLTISTDGLLHTGGTDQIPAGSFAINADGEGNPGGTFGPGPAAVTVTLNSVPNTLVAGDYTGVFDFTISDGEPGEVN